MERGESLQVIFDRLCKKRSEEVALIVDTDTGQTVYFHELPAVCANLVQEIILAIPLRSRKLVLRARSSFMFTLAYLALLRSGITVIPVSPQTPDATVAAILEAAHADGVVSDLDNFPRSGPSICLTNVSADRPPALMEDSRSYSLNQTAVILFTSGTTSSPKGVMLSARSLLSNAQDIAAAVGIDSARLLGILPLYHTNGQIFNIFIPLLTGSTIYCGGDYSITSLSMFWSLIEQYRIEYVDVVPTVIMTLLAIPPIQKPDTSSVKYVICGAAPISESTLAEFEDRFGLRVLQEYGLTEATCISSMETPLERRRGTVGKALSGNVIEVRDRTGRVVQPGKRGEIWIKGTYTMQGYLGGSGKYCLPIENGWLGTGDIGHIDEDGFLTICGRTKNVIIKGGETIIPEDIEKVAQRHQSVADVAAIGRNSSFYGQVIELLVVWRDQQPRIDELQCILKAGLPKALWPDQIHTVSHILRTVSGKIYRRRLIHPAGPEEMV